ncbi:MAG: RsmF rRNA methyltransferase first C-terminal domain-containing protein [Thermomicrobiales bacterium]|nr:RsmF rRNA methyltransferase first C-terminal domain-containing protein [Thermomicrobiales bacterium]
MTTPPLPAAYVERMTALLGDEADAFFASYDQPARPGLRVNTAKITAEDFQQRSPWPLEPVPWCPDGFYLPEGAPAGKHPWHAAGLYYLQEPSAMAPVEQMELANGSWAVDVCAAPGGKATQIHDAIGGEGLLVANEVVGSRVKALGENLERWGAYRAVMSNLEVSRLATLQGSIFDRVLIDAPCSGEGLFRRSPEARAEWSPAHVEGSARRQRGLLESAARLVTPGETIVYSTCTFAPEENEQVIAAFLDTHPAWTLERIDLPGALPGRSDWADTTHDLSGMARLWPHRVEGDGHTIARLRRSELDPPSEPDGLANLGRPISHASETTLAEFADVFTPGFRIDSVPLQQKDSIFMIPSLVDALGPLPMVRPGLWLGTIGPGRFTPSHAFALYLNPKECALVEDLDFEEAARYLSGEPLAKPGKPGWVLITFDDFPLGWGKRSGDVVKNHYPKGLRRPVVSTQQAAVSTQ